MARRVGLTVLPVLLALLAANVAEATYHFAVIDEVMTSYGGDPTVQGGSFSSDGKRYTFTLSEAVPGGVLSVATQVDAEGGAPLWTEEIALQ